jgi:hypothetical protein
LGPVGNGETPAGKSEAPSIFSAAQYVNPGNLTEIIYTDKGALIAIVDKREIEKDPNGESMLMGGVSRYEEQMRVMAFQSWLSERSAASKVSQ